MSASGPVATPASPPAGLEVEYFGCVGGERRSNTCQLDTDGALVLWIAGQRPDVDLDGVTVAATTEALLEGGTRLELRSLRAPGVLTLSRAGATPWSIQLIERPATPRLDAIVAALPDQNAAGRGPALDAALRGLDDALAEMSEYERIMALRIATVVAWDAGKDPTRYGARAMDAALAHGDPSLVADVARIYAHMLGDDARADWVLDVAALYAENVGDAMIRLRLDYALGERAARDGEVGDALARLQASAGLAMRLSLDADEVAARGSAISHLARLGRVAERDAEIARVLEVVDRGGRVDCGEVVTLINISTALVFDRGGVGPAERVLARVLEAFAAGPRGCEAGDNADLKFALDVAHGNRVLASIVRRDWTEAAARLKWFAGRRPGDDLLPSLALYRAEIAMASGDAKAALRELASAPDSALEPRINWRRAITAGHAHARLGRFPAALDAYRRAESALDGILYSVDVDGGREGVGLGLRDGTVAAIGLLHRLGREDEAVVWARRSRARALRPVGRAAKIARLDAATREKWLAAIADYEGARDRLSSDLTGAWRLPADERAALQREHAGLRERMRDAHARAFELIAPLDPSRVDPTEFAPPPVGQLWLVFHPDDEGWIVFGSTATSTRIVHVDRLPSVDDLQGLGSALLGPFAAEIGAAEEVRILAMEGTVAIPFHELPLEDGVLVDSKPIAWALDIGAAPPGPARGRALVVGDPASFTEGAGTLALARSEAELSASTLAAQGFEVERLVAEEATFEHVMRALPTVDWFHYAGHGRAEGVGGWDSALPLAGEASLGVRDLLTAPAVPRAVVLSGCSTAAAHSSTTAGGLSVAAAFVLAGAEFVIGSSTQISDEHALALANALYAQTDAAARRSSGAAVFRGVARRGRAAHEPWTSSIRVWVP